MVCLVDPSSRARSSSLTGRTAGRFSPANPAEDTGIEPGVHASADFEVDVNYMYRVPLWPVSIMDSHRVGSWRVRRIPVVDIHELVAGKLCASWRSHSCGGRRDMSGNTGDCPEGLADCHSD